MFETRLNVEPSCILVVWKEVECWTLNILFVKIHKSSIKKIQRKKICEKIQKIFWNIHGFYSFLTWKFKK